MSGEVFAAVKRDVANLPEALAKSGLAASALALAAEMDDADNSATSKSMCAKALMDALERLRELAPPERKTDGIDDLAAARADRIQRARSAGAANLDGAGGG